jgi:diaminopimelate epimerase
MQVPIPFYKYHALGNDYIVMTPNEFDGELTPEIIRLICHRNYGIGSDGILYGPFDDPECDFALRIYNPDGSPAEKSGNGLRIFTRYLWDQGAIDSRTVSIKTAGGPVKAQIRQQGKIITVHMPGGKIEIEIGPDFAISMTGGVTRVATGTIDPEMFTRKTVAR